MDNQPSSSSALQHAALIALISLALGVLFNYFFVEKALGVGFFIYVLLIAGGLFALAAYFKKPAPKQVLWLLVPLMVFGAMVFVRASEFLTFLNVVACMALLLCIAVLWSGKKISDFLVVDYLHVALTPFKFIPPLLQTLADIFTLRGADNNTQKLSHVVKGVVMTIPVLLILLLLLSSADLVFKKYLVNIVDITPETVVRFVLIVITTLIFTGAYSFIFRRRAAAAEAGQKNPSFTIGHVEIFILLGSIIVLFFLFILVQLTYLFGGADTVISQGFTYAVYARRGFFELIAVAVISFLLLLGVEKFSAKTNPRRVLVFKVISGILVLEVMVIMASAFKRLMLYEEAYGFTAQRFYSHAFIILLACIFLLLLYKIFIDTREHTFAFRTFLLLIVFLAGLNAMNPDGFIAQQNLRRYAQGRELDTVYLARLSTDAIPTAMAALEAPDEVVRNSYARDVYWRADYRKKTPHMFSSWSSWNLSRMIADDLIASKASLLEEQKYYQLEDITAFKKPVENIIPVP